MDTLVWETTLLEVILLPSLEGEWNDNAPWGAKIFWIQESKQSRKLFPFHNKAESLQVHTFPVDRGS